MNKSDPDHPTWKLIRKVARSKNPANVKPGRSLETLAAARKPDLVWRLRRRDRLEFVYNLGWVLHAAIWELDDADEALIEHIGSMPETLFNLSHDSGKW